MIEWTFVSKSHESSFDFCKAECGADRVIVSKIGESTYTVWWWWCDATQTIKHTFNAVDWDEAKAKAISVISNSINSHIEYWQKKQCSFCNWARSVNYD